MADHQQYEGTELEAMSFAVNYHRWIRDEFSPYLGERIVEVGAGIGDFSRLLLETGPHRLYAFEPAENLFPRLAQDVGQRPEVSAFNSVFEVERLSEKVSSIVYVNVLEHIEDDVGELRKAHAALEPGGHLLVFVPALQWLYSKADGELGHFRRYHKKELRALAEDAGYTVLRLRYFDFAGIIPWWVYFVLMRRSFGSGPVSAYDRFVVPVMRPLERLITPPVGKNLLLVAQK